MTTDGSDGSEGAPAGAAPASTSGGPTKEEVQSWVREVLQEAPRDDLDKPATIRDVEDRARAITEEAMKVLRESAPTPPATPPAGDGAAGDGEGAASGGASGSAGAGAGGRAAGESSPQNPRSWQERVRKALGFDD